MPMGSGLGLALIVVLVVRVVLMALGGVLIFNALVRARAMAHEGWSGVEVQLQRRADLVPGLVLGLVLLVATLAGHERSVLRVVAAQRSAALVADR